MKNILTQNFAVPAAVRFRSRKIIYRLTALLLLLGFFPSAAQSAAPALPQTFLDTTYTPPGGNTISVAAGGDLQSAINNAQPGDTLSLAAGATFAGNFTLPNKSGAGWIVIRTSVPDSSLPPPGTRITAADAALMPKIVSPNTSYAISTAESAHHYRFIGVEITTTHANTGSTLYNLVAVGTGSETSTGQLPSDLIFDRCYIHGTPTGSIRRGIALNGARIAVIDSHLSEFHEVGNDSQAIMGWNGTGPFKIVNNYLEGAGENILFGGWDPTIANLVPSDIEVRGNHLFKPLKWKGSDPSYAGINWVVKNIFELKNARRVLIEGNVFEHNWPDDQNGFSILFTVRNQSGGAPWSTIEDVTFTNNILRHAAAGINILGRDDISGSSQQTKRVLIQNNLFDDVGGSQWGNGRLFQVGNGAADVTIDHNTAVHTENVIFAYAASTTGFVYRNNLTPHQGGVVGDGVGMGTSALNSYFPGYEFRRNVLAGGNPGNYPPDGYFPASMSDVGFVNLAGGNYRLAPSSPYKNAGTDGKDLGADIDAIEAALNGTGSEPDPSDTTAPVISAVSSPVITSFGATITWTTDEASNTQVEYGATTAYGSSSTLNGSMVTSHSQNLTGLSANTLYHYRVKSRDAAGNLAVSGDQTFTTLVAVQSPFTAPFSIPGLIEAENFDNGGEGLAYHDLTSGNQGGSYRTDFDVDIVPNGGGYAINGFQTGEWLGYTINVAQSGLYRIEAGVSSEFTSSRWHIEIDGVNLTGSVSVPGTGSWNTFQFVGTGGVNLTAGLHTLRIVSDQEYFNLDSIRIVADATTNDTTPPAVSVTAPASGSTVSGTTTLSAGASDNVSVVGVQFKLNGVDLGAEDTAAPYSVSWNSASAANGAHTLTAVARDAAGNSTTSAAVSITVNNTASLSVSPTSLSFGSVAVGSASAAQGVQITNTGSVGASVSSVTITGPFAISENYCVAGGTWDGVMTPGTHCDIAVVFAPVGSGSGSGTLSITAAGNVYLVALSGNNDATEPTSGLLSHWKLDEGSGNKTSDDTGNGHLGTLKNRAAWTSGKEGSAVAFDGKNDYVQIPHDDSLNTYPLTISAWIKANGSGVQGIVNKYQRNSYKGYQLFLNDGNLCAWYFKDADNYVWDGTQCSLGTAGTNDDQWHHVAFVVDDTGGKLYVDGNETASLAWTGNPGAVSTTKPVNLGRYQGMSGSYFTGAMDDVRIYNRALSAGEILDLFYLMP